MDCRNTPWLQEQNDNNNDNDNYNNNQQKKLIHISLD